MSTLAEMKIDGRAQSVFPTRFKTDSLRKFAFADVNAVSAIQGASVSFEIDLEEETDSDAFFAAWFLDKSQKDVNVDITPVGQTSKFLTIGCLGAQCVHYNVIIDQHIDSKTQNSTVLIELVCLTITIGQSPLTIGF